MKKNNENQKGFIQMPLLMAIIVGVLILGSGGYFGIKQYHKYQLGKNEKEMAAQKVEEQKKSEIESLRKEVEELKDKQVQSQTQSSRFPTPQPEKSNGLASNLDIDNFLTAVGQLTCFNQNSNEKSIGSAFLWKKNGNFLVFTNKHVFEGKKNCLFVINQTLSDSKRWGVYYLDVSHYYNWNSATDFGFFYLTNDLKNKIENNQESANVEDLNYSIASLSMCSAKAKQGAEVYMIGYPAYSNTGLNSTRIVTEGIISGYEPFFINGATAFPNYYVSNKTDSGNSGGAVLSIEDGNFCMLGITTWLSLGNYETQGIVQNIRNVFLNDDGLPTENPFKGIFGN